MTEHESTDAGKDKPRVRRSIWLAFAISLFAAFVLAFPRSSLTAPMPNTVHMADMTWVEVRSAIQRGYTVAIVPTGGIEQNGAHMVLGKHDYIIQKTTDRIAQELGNALVTPVVSYVPEGSYDPPSGNMLFPGTLGVPESAFAAVLEGIARSLKSAGFKTICFIGDHGGSQAGQAAVAAKLNREWAGLGMTVLHVADYYNVDKAQTDYLREHGETQATIGYHAGIMDTSELLAAHPRGVDLTRLKTVPLHSEPTGASGDPTHASAEYGKALLAIKIDAALRQIRAAEQKRSASN
jgi:creatinine amidohydrolase